MTREERKESIIAYVGTIIDDIQGMTEDEIRATVIDDIKLMSEEEATFTRDNLAEIVEEALSAIGGPWHAVMKDHDDDDWGYGSYNLIRAKEMCLEYPDGYIAVIQEGIDPICIDEIEVKKEDF